MKYLIAGLGNPGEEYAHTRHNIGFDVLDALARASNTAFKDKRYGFISEFRYKSRTFHLLKPTTYVNLSGRAVNYYLKKHKIPLEHLLVVVDDLALPFGKLRLRQRGGDAGHNGLINITQILGTNDFPRLRFGIGNDFPKGQQVDYVLGKWTEEEARELSERIDLACEIILSFGTIGIEYTMTQFNKN
ncbi:MAG: aminoacyl-tRNA hydrolase [Bacteroidota bacterium]